MTTEPSLPIGTVISDDETPTFETVRIKLKAGCEVKPGVLIKIPVDRIAVKAILVGRISSAYEHNPNEQAESINVRDTLGIRASYPAEEDSTTIYRLVEADVIEEIVPGGTQAPQTLPKSGALVFEANQLEIVQSLGLESDKSLERISKLP